MNDSFLWHTTKRCIFYVTIAAVFCLLPGPRRIVMNGLSHLLSPQAQDSLWAGFHLSLIHFCWLLDFEMQHVPYADTVDPLLANAACLFGILLQLAAVGVLWVGSRCVFIYYDPERPTEETVDAIDEELSVEPLHVTPRISTPSESTVRAG